MDLSERHTNERIAGTPEEIEGTVLENIKPQNAPTEYWCIPEDTEEGNYLMMDPASEFNEKGNMGLEEIPASQHIDIVDDQDKEWIDDRSKPEVEFDDEQQQT